jgi:hypothetical protein
MDVFQRIFPRDEMRFLKILNNLTVRSLLVLIADGLKKAFGGVFRY